MTTKNRTTVITDEYAAKHAEIPADTLTPAGAIDAGFAAMREFLANELPNPAATTGPATWTSTWAAALSGALSEANAYARDLANAQDVDGGA